ncbi:Signal transduction histidine kinase [Hahella chejuensis KCTC 2396]|uniref:histidine kinase n=1 Tax=Hahella chejuensis (strain KCTC 2396) TaxID=349521 RepID=Q2SBZ5_HAHCH|nr:ATP-binding protein [Hahella chejuensis]ABC31829.1 Signal transduction histidine kinase [Hahella chejuensis KCTC 2396]
MLMLKNRLAVNAYQPDIVAYKESKAANASRSGEKHPFLNALPYPAVVHSHQGEFIACNTLFLREFSSDPKTLARLTSHRDSFLQLFQPVEAKDAHLKGDAFSLQAHCGETNAFYALNSAPFYDAEGERLLLSVQRVEEPSLLLLRPEDMHAQLQQASKSMSIGEMATALTHELNQPIGAILNYLNAAKLLLEKHTGVDKPEEAVQLAIRQAHQAAAVVARIRKFVTSREPRADEISLRQLASGVLELLQLETHRSQVKPRLLIAADIPCVCVDRIMIEQTLGNLIRNAMDAMRDTPIQEREFIVDAQVIAEGWVEVSVTDRGCGIPQHFRNRLFTPFFTTKPDGMGAGLSISKSFIELHRGTLRFKDNPSGGSVFLFTLPLASTATPCTPS